MLVYRQHKKVSHHRGTLRARPSDRNLGAPTGRAAADAGFSSARLLTETRVNLKTPAETFSEPQTQLLQLVLNFSRPGNLLQASPGSPVLWASGEPHLLWRTFTIKLKLVEQHEARPEQTCFIRLNHQLQQLHGNNFIFQSFLCVFTDSLLVITE